MVHLLVELSPLRFQLEPDPIPLLARVRLGRFNLRMKRLAFVVVVCVDFLFRLLQIRFECGELLLFVMDALQCFAFRVA